MLLDTSKQRLNSTATTCEGLGRHPIHVLAPRAASVPRAGVDFPPCIARSSPQPHSRTKLRAPFKIDIVPPPHRSLVVRPGSSEFALDLEALPMDEAHEFALALVGALDPTIGAVRR